MDDRRITEALALIAEATAAIRNPATGLDGAVWRLVDAAGLCLATAGTVREYRTGRARLVLEVGPPVVVEEVPILPEEVTP